MRSEEPTVTANIHHDNELEVGEKDFGSVDLVFGSDKSPHEVFNCPMLATYAHKHPDDSPPGCLVVKVRNND